MLSLTTSQARAFAAYGVFGYVVHLAGTVAELFGYPVSDFALIPGALFEIALLLWLFVKGFSANAYGMAA